MRCFGRMEREQLGIRISNTYTPCILIPLLNGSLCLFMPWMPTQHEKIPYASWHVGWEIIVDMQVSCYKHKSKDS